MLTEADYLAHCEMIATLDPSYAAKAAKWYGNTLELPALTEWARQLEARRKQP